MNPLGEEIRAIIESEGPIGVDRYMTLCLQHPRHGYYTTREAIGRDFVTAPEVHQMFGELVGLWAAQVWLDMGSPAPLRLVELGPGRGTLMADVLRATRMVPGFHAAARVHLVETSPRLREAQAGKLASTGVPLAWHAALDDVPEGAAIVLANEFFDALPVRHYWRGTDGWHERVVGLDGDGALAFGASAERVALAGAAGRPGDILEVGHAALAAMTALAGRIATRGGALLALDYGHAESGLGETLQAVRGHRYAAVLAEPGEADLTAHVDFAALARAASAAGRAAVRPDHAGYVPLPPRHRRARRCVEAPRDARAGGGGGFGARPPRRAGLEHGHLVQGAGGGRPKRRPAPRFRGARMTQDVPVPAITAEALAPFRHAFFTREGGVSSGVYASFNGGVGSRDAPEAVAENRRRMAAHLGAATLLVPYQIHSPTCLAVTGPWDERPRADALATATPGLALGVTGADCGMILYADATAGVVGASHAGWQGAFGGVLEATLDSMETLGARRAAIVAVLGPTIGPASYEVGPEFAARFVARDAGYAAFFAPSVRAGHAMFDLPGFIGHRLRAAGVGRFENLGLDTYADERRFFSYRRTTHRAEPDYGRLISAIVAG